MNELHNAGFFSLRVLYVGLYALNYRHDDNTVHDTTKQAVSTDTFESALLFSL